MIKNLYLLVILLGLFLNGCGSSKPSCDDKKVISEVNYFLKENSVTRTERGNFDARKLTFHPQIIKINKVEMKEPYHKPAGIAEKDMEECSCIAEVEFELTSERPYLMRMGEVYKEVKLKEKGSVTYNIYDSKEKFGVANVFPRLPFDGYY